MSKTIAENSEISASIRQFEQLAETIQSFMDEQSMLVSFMSVLLAAVDLMEQEKNHLIDNNIRLNQQSCDLYEQIADMYKIIGYDCQHNKPTPDKLEFAQLCFRIENISRTIIQHSQSCLDNSKGYFYASEQNMAQLCEDSLTAIEATSATINANQPVDFIEIR